MLFNFKTNCILIINIPTKFHLKFFKIPLIFAHAHLTQSLIRRNEAYNVGR